MIAEELMTREPVTVTESTSIGDALIVLREEGIRHLPVVRGSDVIGILSDRDFSSIGASMLSHPEGVERVRAQLTQPVSLLMTGGVVTADVDSELGDIMDLMIDEKLSAVPVVESGTTELVGIVSYLDILRALRSIADQD